MDVLHHLRAHLLPGRPPCHEVVLNDPLLEELTRHRALILDAKPLLQVGFHLVIRSWCDGVDHAVREAAILLHPRLQRFVHRIQLLHHLGMDIIAVLGDVVARENGHAAMAHNAAGLEARNDIPHHSGAIILLRLLIGRCKGIVSLRLQPLTSGQLEQKFILGAERNGVSKLCNCHGHNAGFLGRQAFQQLAWGGRAHEDVVHGAHHLHVLLGATAVALDDRVAVALAAILFLVLLAGCLAHTCACVRPALGALEIHSQ
mmetsp:Transcript_23257/g.59600  ORF Transcript_23257/g.59600 Transcript_23257/m.59600 type:complete len:259 (-) Transcript_23257:501-1277(-)